MRGPVFGLIVVVLIVVAVVFVVGRLRQSAQMEDCLASGRTNCAPVEAPSR